MPDLLDQLSDTDEITSPFSVHNVAGASQNRRSLTERDDYFDISAGTNVRIEIKISPTSSLPNWFIEVAEEIENLLQINDGWDSYGGSAPSPQIIKETLLILSELPDSNIPSPQIFPTNQGGIQLNWEIENKDIEIRIQSPTEVNAFIENIDTGNIQEYHMTMDTSPIRSIFQELAE